MRRLLALAILLYALPIYGQGNSGKSTLVQSSTVPLPNCTPAIVGTQEPLVWDITNQLLKTCGPAANQWTATGGGGGGGGSVTNFSIAGATSPFFSAVLTAPNTSPLLTF